MAEHLASIFGTEKDRVNCPFYFKIGACRHGDRCSRIHNKPTISQTLLLQNMYQNPAMSMPPGPDGLPPQIDPRQSQEHFEDFYEDIFEEFAKFGEVENLNVCDNVADHMVGSVYTKFVDENAAAMALQGLTGRYYQGRPILVEFSPVTDFREATCRQYEENTCTRGGYCNFMHLRPISRDLRKHLFGRYKRRDNDGGRPDDRGGRRRSRSRERGRERDRGGRGQDRPRETSAERRAKIASWNKSRRDGGGAPGGGAPPSGPPGGTGYGAPPPAGAPGGYSGPPPTHGGYGAPPGGAYGQQPPPQPQSGGYAPPPQGGGYPQPPPQGGYQ